MMKYKIIIMLLFVGISGLVYSQTNELSLQNAVEIALEKNYSIIMSQKNAEISETNNSWANTGAMPTVSFVGSAYVGNNINNNDNFSQTNLSGSVDVNWIIFRGFSAKIQKEKLEEYQNMSDANLAIMVENTIQNVISAYYGVLLAQEKFKISESNMKLSYDRYQRELQKKEIGTSVTYDLLQSKNAYLSDTADYMMSESSYKNTMRQLNYLMSVPVNNEYVFITSFESEQTDFVYDDLLSKMKSNNTTLQNQYINLELAKLNVQSSKSAYYPTVSAGVSAGLQNSNMDYSTMDAMDNTNSAFSTSANIAISYDIYTGGSRKIAVDVAKIESEISDIQRVDLEQSLENQMAQEFELYNVRKELLFLAEENLKAAELNLELSKMKFESGVISSFNYRDIQTLHLNTALNYQNAIYNLIQSYYTLMRLTGGIVEDFN